jgi:hypothetical protein
MVANPTGAAAEKLLSQKTKRVVVLMPSFGDCPIRRENQEFVVAWYQERGMPTILGADARGKRSGWFSRARAMNYAARQAVREYPERDVFVLADNDLIPDPTMFLAAVQTVDHESAIMPHAITLLTDPQGRREVFMRGTTNRVEPVEQGSRSFVVMTRANYAAVNGMDEMFEGWGPEDLAFRLSVTKQLRPPRELEGRRLHLWHPIDPSKRDVKQLYFNRRRKHMYQLKHGKDVRTLAREYGRWDRDLQD